MYETWHNRPRSKRDKYGLMILFQSTSARGKRRGERVGSRALFISRLFFASAKKVENYSFLEMGLRHSNDQVYAEIPSIPPFTSEEASSPPPVPKAAMYADNLALRTQEAEVRHRQLCKDYELAYFNNNPYEDPEFTRAELDHIKSVVDETVSARRYAVSLFLSYNAESSSKLPGWAIIRKRAEDYPDGRGAQISKAWVNMCLTHLCREVSAQLGFVLLGPNEAENHRSYYHHTNSRAPCARLIVGSESAYYQIELSW